MTPGAVTFRGKRYTYRQLAWRFRLEEHVIVGRWKRGDRGERLVRPVGVDARPTTNLRCYLP